MGFKLIEKEKDPTFYVLDINLDKVHKKPSFHLNLCLQRFIIASKIWSKKQISKSIFNDFKLIHSQLKIFLENAKSLSNSDNFWILQNPEPFFKNSNNQICKPYISTYISDKLPAQKVLLDIVRICSESPAWP